MKRLKDFLQKENTTNQEPDLDGDGFLSPEELHKHLDIQNRGKVDIGDYAAHILFHARHPEYLSHVTDKFNDTQRRHANGEIINPDDSVFNKIKGDKTLVATSTPMTEGKNSHEYSMDPPAILIMRRKSIRQFPNGQRVALYYVDKIHKFVTVPYDEMQWSSAMEETIIDQLTNSVQYKENIIVEHFDGSVSYTHLRAHET